MRTRGTDSGKTRRSDGGDYGSRRRWTGILRDAVGGEIDTTVLVLAFFSVVMYVLERLIRESRRSYSAETGRS